FHLHTPTRHSFPTRRSSDLVVELRPLVLHEGVVQSRQEVVRRGGAVMLLGVQPAGRKAGVPGENDLALGGGPGRRRELRGRRSDGEQNQGDGQEPERTTSLESGTPHAGASIHGDELDHREGCRRLARGPTGGQVAATRIWACLVAWCEPAPRS